MKKEKNKFSTQGVCTLFDVTKTTLFKWEKEGKLNQVEKDWRGWRVFSDDNIKNVRKIILEKKRKNT